MRRAFAYRGFVRLWVAQSLSGFGDWLMVVAVPFFVYDRTKSAVATAFVFAAEAGPQVVLSPIAGVLVDRYNRVRLLTVANLASAIVVLVIVAAEALSSVPLIIAVVFAQSCLTQVLVPARNALVPALVPASDLAAANSLDQLTDSSARVVAPGVGALILGSVGISAAAIIDAATFAMAAILVAGIRLTGAPHVADIGPRLRAAFAEGAAAVRSDLSARQVFAVFGIVMFGQGLLNVGLVAILADIGGATAYGFVIMMQGVGSIAGSFLTTATIARFGVGRVMATALAASGVAVGAYALAPSVGVAALLSTLIGVFVIHVVVTAQTKLQTDVPLSVLGRVSGLLTSSTAVAMLLGLSAASVLGGALGTRYIVLGASLCLVAGAAVVARFESSRVSVAPNPSDS